MKVILILPTLIFFAIFTIWPLCEVIWLSFFKTNFIVTKFVFLDNYKNVITNPDFLQSVYNSLFYTILLAPAQVFFGFVGALVVFELSKKWQDISRILFYVPVLSSGIIIAQVWKWAFGMEGPFNWLLSFINISPIAWFAKGETGIPTVAFIVLFSSIGGNIIIILTALLDVDKSLIDSGKIDGANYFQCVKHILTPAISPILKVVFIASIVNAFQIYETIMMLCPYIHTSTMTYYIYQTGFKNSNYGSAAVESILLMIIVMSLLAIQKKIKNEKRV